MDELLDLIGDTEDAIMFLRSLMFGGSTPTDGADQSDSWREEHGREVCTGDKPKSKPPMSIGALDAADAEIAVLVAWAEFCGIPFQGQVWRVQGVPRGVLYGDVRPVRSLVRALTGLAAEGWCAPAGMVEGVRDVRVTNLRCWPELDVFLARPGQADDDEQEALF